MIDAKAFPSSRLETLFNKHMLMTFQHLFSVTIVASSWSLQVVVTAISGIVIFTSTFVLSGPSSSGTVGSEAGSRGTGNGEVDLGITLIGTAGEGGTVSEAGI